MSRISIFINMEGSENHTGYEFHTVYGWRHYHNSPLHLGGNWAHHKYHIAVPFSFAFILFPQKIPCTLLPPKQVTLHGLLDYHILAITFRPWYTLASLTGFPNAPHCVGSPTTNVAGGLHLFCTVWIPSRNDYTVLGRRGGQNYKLAGLFLEIQRCTTYVFSRYQVGLEKKSP